MWSAMAYNGYLEGFTDIYLYDLGTYVGNR